MSTGFDEWFDHLSELPFEDRAIAIRDKILEKTVLDEKSSEVFNMTFDYAIELVKANKPFELEHLHKDLQKRGHKNVSVTELSRLLTLLEFCGFNFSHVK